MLATFFTRSMLAAIVGPIALFAFLMIRYVLFATPASELAWAKWIISLLSPSVRLFVVAVAVDLVAASVAVVTVVVFFAATASAAADGDGAGDDDVNTRTHATGASLLLRFRAPRTGKKKNKEQQKMEQ